MGRIHARGVWESTPAEPTDCGEVMVHDEVMSTINTRVTKTQVGKQDDRRESGRGDRERSQPNDTKRDSL